MMEPRVSETDLGAYETAKGAELDKKDSFVAVLVADVCSVRHAQGARRSAR